MGIHYNKKQPVRDLRKQLNATVIEFNHRTSKEKEALERGNYYDYCFHIEAKLELKKELRILRKRIHQELVS